MKNKNKLSHKLNFCLKLFFATTILSFYSNSFCMENSDKTWQLNSEETTKELNFFWGENAPWPKCGHYTVICTVMALAKKTLNSRYYIETHEHTFTSKLYSIGALYLKDKTYLMDKTNNDKIPLKSFYDNDKENKFELVFSDDKTGFIDKKTGILNL